MSTDCVTASKATNDIEDVTSCHSSKNLPKRERTLKEKALFIIESNSVTIFMTLITIFVLYSEHVRILSFDKSYDEGFMALSAASFFLFLIEITVQCWCKENYLVMPDVKKIKEVRYSYSMKWHAKAKLLFQAIQIGSFYFWLDLVATMSMVLEIPWLTPSSGIEVNDNLESARAGKASRAGAKAARLVKIVRMVRLVRLVKLYKYFSEKKNKKDGTITPDDFEELEHFPKETHVGAEMSDRTTKKVILGILIMLVVIPILQDDELVYVNEFGLQMVFERWEALINLDPSVPHDKRAVQTSSWKYAEEQFINSTECIKLTYVGFDESMHEFANIPEDRPSPESLRFIEMENLAISETSDAYSISAGFDASSRAKEEAFLGLLLTTFVILLLALGTMTFSRDVNNLVIIPIEKMVHMVREISANPLGKNLSLDSEHLIGVDDGMETTLLLRTISKIAGLMRVGFGEAGAEIIGKNLNMSHDEGDDLSMNLLGNGRKIQSIFGFCDVRNFTDTTECLQEEVMLFVNRIAHILHSIVVQCDGAANKNIGDAFLLTWKIDPKKIGSCKDHGYSGDKALFSLLKTMVELIRQEDFICNFSPSALGALYERMPGYKCRIGCGLHFGWAVEGAIGSDKKIDASYISPHVNWAEFLESSTKLYGVPLLMSQPFYDLLSPEASRYCRQVDNIKKSKTDEGVGIYTYDANLDIEVRSAPKANARLSTFRNKGTMRKTTISRGTLISKDSDPTRRQKDKKNDRVRNSFSVGEAPEIKIEPFKLSVWDKDGDIMKLRMHFDSNQRRIWANGIGAFICGDWNVAIVHFNKVLDLTHGNDGPAKYILSVMEEYNFTVPKDWDGYRRLS